MIQPVFRKVAMFATALVVAGSVTTVASAAAASQTQPSDAVTAAMTCSAWTNSAKTIAYGRCSGTINRQWRLGVICDKGYYYWSPWQDKALTKSYDCPGSPGKVSNVWIDLK